MKKNGRGGGGRAAVNVLLLPRRRSLSLAFYATTPQSATVISSRGRSPGPVGKPSILRTMSMPSVTSPKTTWRPSSQGVGTVQRNWGSSRGGGWWGEEEEGRGRVSEGERAAARRGGGREAEWSETHDYLRTASRWCWGRRWPWTVVVIVVVVVVVVVVVGVGKGG
jgi:hypothetical protein